MSQLLRTLLANELTLKRQVSDPEKLSDSIRSSNIDLNPHQVEAAIFAFKSPLSRGAILADEVGLGKTIEAGLVINQLWVEGRKKILILAPASLRTQWQDELRRHFELESVIIDGPAFKKLIKLRSKTNPLNEDGIYIASHNFGHHYDVACKEVPWDLVVIDEAHRLRNVYRKGNKVAKAVRDAIANRPKLLLTATPLQNNLMELFGLVSFIDERYLGTDYSFRTLYLKPSRNSEKQLSALLDLKLRLMGEIVDGVQHGGILTRALRSQVQSQGLVHFTNRFCITEDFHPNDDEIELYDLVSEYLRRPQLASTLATQRNMMELVYRKILASSSFAIAGTLGSVANFVAKRLQLEHGVSLDELLKIVEEESRSFKNKWHREAESIAIGQHSPEENISETLPGMDDVELSRDEYSEEETESDDLGEDEPLESGEEKEKKQAELPPMTKEETLEEFRDVLSYYFLAKSITKNQKTHALLGALKKVFKHAEKMDWPQKAVIFTESRRTQDHLEAMLKSQSYNVVLFNGSNASKEANEIFSLWTEEHPEEAARGSRSINIRKALVWHFKNLDKAVLITTEAGAEGLNLQFANIVINYDLPWNPQRIEQRIGRCHRYGQPLDVMVVNFINRKNYADERVYELLKEKIKLFGNLFDFSDVILGTEEKRDDGFQVREIALGGIGSGIDFEKKVLRLYRNCRTKAEIEKDFKALQMDLFEAIEEKVEDTQRKVIQHFDEDVHKKLKLRQELLANTLNKYDRKLLAYVETVFADKLEKLDDRTFVLDGVKYRLGTINREEWEGADFKKAHTSDPLFSKLLNDDRDKSVVVEVTMKHKDSAGRKVLQELVGKELQLKVERVIATRSAAHNQEETFEELIFSAISRGDDGWTPVSPGILPHLSELEVVAEEGDNTRLRDDLLDEVERNRAKREAEKVTENEAYVDMERDQIRRYAKESLMRHESDMQKIRDEMDTLESQLGVSRTLGFHERQEIQDQVDALRKDYFKAQERYFKAEKEQFLIQDETVRKLKSQMQLKFRHKQIASARIRIVG